MPIKDIKGQRFGTLTVIRLLGKTERRRAIWLVRCDCGLEKPMVSCELPGATYCSPKCQAKPRGHRWLHGLSESATYVTYKGMLQRCNNPKDPSYERYGARGIKVADRWLVFANFVADMGERPEGMSIDRIDSNGNYEPGNCRWATRIQQANNKRSVTLIEHNGKALSLDAWARELNINRITLRARVKKYGWPIEKALTTPPIPTNQRPKKNPAIRTEAKQ